MNDRILVKDLQVFARHGLKPEEKTLGQRFAVDVVAHLDLAPAGQSDDYGQTVCYDTLIRTVVETLTRQRFYLIEAAAEAVAGSVLAAFPRIERVCVEVRKPAAAIEAVFAYVGVAVERGRDG